VWKVPELNGLPRQRERAADERLGGDDGRHRRKNDDEHPKRAPRACQREERVFMQLRILEEQCALPEVVQQQRGEDGRPRVGDGAPTEMPHVRVERLAARDAQDDASEHEEARPVVRPEELNSMGG
jgi:hypothetical protein